MKLRILDPHILEMSKPIFSIKLKSGGNFSFYKKGKKEKLADHDQKTHHCRITGKNENA